MCFMCKYGLGIKKNKKKTNCSLVAQQKHTKHNSSKTQNRKRELKNHLSCLVLQKMISAAVVFTFMCEFFFVGLYRNGTFFARLTKTNNFLFISYQCLEVFSNKKKERCQNYAVKLLGEVIFLCKDG